MANFIPYEKDAPIEEKKKILIVNARRLATFTKPSASKRKEIKTSTQAFITSSFSSEETFTQNSPSLKTLDQDFINLYTSLIAITKKENFCEGLWTKINPEDKTTIARLKLQAYQDFVLLNNMFFTDPHINKDDIILELDAITTLLDALDENIPEVEVDDTALNESNKSCEIYFYESNHKLPFFESLDKDLPTDIYMRVKTLLLSMKAGHFKGFKSLISRKYLFEVKSDMIRIFFIIIAPGKILIMDVYPKKEMISQGYRNQLSLIESAAEYAKEVYPSLIMQEGFLKKHEEYFNDIITFCETKGRGLK